MQTLPSEDILCAVESFMMDRKVSPEDYRVFVQPWAGGQYAVALVYDGWHGMEITKHVKGNYMPLLKRIWEATRFADYNLRLKIFTRDEFIAAGETRWREEELRHEEDDD